VKQRRNLRGEEEKRERKGLSFVEVGKNKNASFREEKPCQVSISQTKGNQKKRSSSHWI
jgi:hypothetical protein